MRQWEQDKNEGRVKSSPTRQLVSASSSESFEKQLFADIKRLIERSYEEESEVREETLREAENMQVQLSARLESNGCYHLAKYLFDQLGELRAKGMAHIA